MRIESENGWDRVIHNFEELNRHYVAVGFFGGEKDRILMIAHVNEYGAIITPKKGQWLTLPTKDTPRRADGSAVPAREIPGLFKPKGKHVLCVSDGKGSLTVMYVLVKKVHIPARPFMRSTLNNNLSKYQQMVFKCLDKIMAGHWDWHEALKWIGETCVTDMQDSITNWTTPPNAPLTVSRKGVGDPLVDTGSMRNAVTFKIMEG